ncbi:hypothetical protein GCM10010917_32290 [Paenibacillus physcomitrellae]|uniref:Uncharacterized protein n=1 Tax=Paenibacillus physcomitrellae TaxID=1619311 RepID=A0ABQ1GIX9_9BACL|nr:hypothetical protein GCM10010917_32290 [Paenibacillus physcomitrellae]
MPNRRGDKLLGTQTAGSSEKARSGCEERLAAGLNSVICQLWTLPAEGSPNKIPHPSKGWQAAIC